MKSLLAVVVPVFLSACSGGIHALSPGDVTNYEQLASDAAGQLQTYCTSTSTMSSPGDCTTALQRHVGSMRSDLAGMSPLAGGIDDHMMGMGTMPAGDMRCAMDAMSRELGRHETAACTSADMTVNRTEAQDYCTQMQGYLDHMQMRGAEAAGMMGSGMMGSGMMTVPPDGGWMMSDGGTLGWDHQMSDCGSDGG